MEILMTYDDKLKKLNDLCNLLYCSNDRMTFTSGVLNQEHRETLRRSDKYSIKYDHKSNVLAIETWDESHHNGDSYNENSMTCTPDETEVDALLKTMTDLGIKYIIKIEEQQKQEAERARLLAKLDHISSLHNNIEAGIDDLSV